MEYGVIYPATKRKIISQDKHTHESEQPQHDKHDLIQDDDHIHVDHVRDTSRHTNERDSKPHETAQQHSTRSILCDLSKIRYYYYYYGQQTKHTIWKLENFSIAFVRVGVELHFVMQVSQETKPFSNLRFYSI